jgi:nucleoside-diphosphate-sugar epimerase
VTDTSRKEAALTGASGFIGRNLAKRLLSDGWKVNVIARPGSDLKPLSGYAGDLSVHIHDGTMEGMMGLFGNMAPSIVFHLASLFIADHASRDIPRLVNSNILLGLQLVEAMSAKNVKHFINTGTAWQHYRNERYDPVNLYAASKEAFEALLQYYVKARGLKAITLKLFDTYGPNDPRPKLFAFLRGEDQGNQELAMSPGEQLLDLVYVDDVVDAFLTAAARLPNNEGEAYEEYAVSSGRLMALKDLVALFQDISGKKRPIRWGGKPYRAREVMVPWSEGRKIAGWNPKVPIEQGIALMDQGLRERSVR